MLKFEDKFGLKVNIYVTFATSKRNKIHTFKTLVR